MPFLKFVWVFFLREKQLQTNTSDLELRGDSVAPQNQSKSRFAYCWDTLNLNHGKETQASVFFRQPCARILTDEMDPKRSTKGPRVSWAYDLELLHHCSPDFNTSTRLLFAPRVSDSLSSSSLSDSPISASCGRTSFPTFPNRSQPFLFYGVHPWNLSSSDSLYVDSSRKLPLQYWDYPRLISRRWLC